MREYIDTFTERVFKIMQIETIEGYENLDQIMDVDGIDSIFVGAADLSRSIDGYRGGKGYTVNDVYDDICRRVKDKGLYLGAAIGPSKEDAQRVTEKGVQWVVFGQDVKILAQGLKYNLDQLNDF